MARRGYNSSLFSDPRSDLRLREMKGAKTTTVMDEQNKYEVK